LDDIEADSMTGATRLPTYYEVVEQYGLEILKSPGDLVLKDGNLALTKIGDLMLKNAEYSAMFRLVQRWRFNAPTLQSLFDLVFTTKCRRIDLDDSLNGVFLDRRFDPKAANPFIPDQSSLDRYHELNDEIGANELASVAYAGAVVLVLSGLLRSFKDDMDATRDEWEKSAPLIEGCSIGSILAASANNFRHNDEWAKTRRPKQNQLASIRVLAAVFQEQIAPDGTGHRLSRDICAETLELLGGGNFYKLSANLFAFANNMVKRRG
jgi:hypothetical protein